MNSGLSHERTQESQASALDNLATATECMQQFLSRVVQRFAWHQQLVGFLFCSFSITLSDHFCLIRLLLTSDQSHHQRPPTSYSIHVNSTTTTHSLHIPHSDRRGRSVVYIHPCSSNHIHPNSRICQHYVRLSAKLPCSSRLRLPPTHHPLPKLFPFALSQFVPNDDIAFFVR